MSCESCWVTKPLSLKRELLDDQCVVSEARILTLGCAHVMQDAFLSFPTGSMYKRFVFRTRSAGNNKFNCRNLLVGGIVYFISCSMLPNLEACEYHLQIEILAGMVPVANNCWSSQGCCSAIVCYLVVVNFGMCVSYNVVLNISESLWWCCVSNVTTACMCNLRLG